MGKTAATFVLTCGIALTGCDKLPLPGSAAESTPDAADPAAEAPADAAEGAAGAEGESPEPSPADDEAPGDGNGNGNAGSVAWTVIGDSLPIDMRVAADGAVVAVYEDKMVGYVDGKPAWTKEGAFTELVRLQDGSLLATAGPRVVGFEPATGNASFEVTVPAPAGAKPENPAAVVGAEAYGSQVLLALDDARFFVVDPPACGSEATACMRPGGALAGEFLERTAVLKVSDEGTRYLGEDDTMRAFDLALELQWSLAAPANIVGMTPVPGERLALAFGGQIALLDAAKCIGKTEIRLTRAGGTIAPKGCVMWRYGRELDDVAPAVIDDSTLAANGNQRLQAVVNGTDSWKSPLGSIGRVILGNDELLYTVTVHEDAAGQMSLAVTAVDAKLGTVAWIVRLPFALDPGSVVVPESLRIDWQAGWIAVAKDASLALVSVPGPSKGA